MTKNFIVLMLLLGATTFSTAQEEWGDVNKNTVTMKELPPQWPGCEGESATELNRCFTTKLSQHIGKNFKYPTEAYKNNEQGKVIVDFKINTDGNVEIVSVSGGTPALQKEAKRNIMEIPQMKPGMLAGKPRAISYKVPFNFNTGKN